MTALLEISGLGTARGGREILRDVSLEASPGLITAIMGLSGGGKTTILRTVAALDPFDRGSVRVADVTLEAGPLPRGSRLLDVRRRVGMVFQLHHLFEHLTAIENVMLAPVHAARMDLAVAEGRAVELLQTLGVAHRRDAVPRELSGGEAQRVAIARAMAMDPALLLLDEPTASLDPARRFELGRILRKLAADGRTLVMTTHDEDFVRQFADQVAILADGQIADSGTPAEVLDAPRHPATRALLQVAHESR